MMWIQPQDFMRWWYEDYNDPTEGRVITAYNIGANGESVVLICQPDQGRVILSLADGRIRFARTQAVEILFDTGLELSFTASLAEGDRSYVVFDPEIIADVALELTRGGKSFSLDIGNNSTSFPLEHAAQATNSFLDACH